ncbi:MAG: hypothetical protein AAF649_01180 [Verrucomicrobiota bacterium]
MEIGYTRLLVIQIHTYIHPLLRQKPLYWCFIILSCSWLILWYAGYPLPNGDDGFFTGTAIHFAKTGILYNPWIEGFYGWFSTVADDRFFLQPPGHSALMACWINIFGVSSASLTGYACFWGWAAASSAGLLMLRWNHHTYVFGAAAVVISLWALGRGLRPESAGLALTLWGFLLYMQGRHALIHILSAFLLSSAVLVHAFTLCLVIPGFIICFLNKTSPISIWRNRSAECFQLTAGIMSALLVFIWLIEGRLMDFLNDFLAHGSFVRMSQPNPISAFYHQIMLGYELYPNLITVCFAVVGIIWGYKVQTDHRTQVYWGLATLLAVTIFGLLLYPRFTAAYFMLGTALLAMRIPAQGMAARLITVIPCLSLISWMVLEHSLQTVADRQHDHTSFSKSIYKWADSSAYHTILFDAATLRYIFDFRPPENSQDITWAWSPGRSLRWYDPQHREAGDIWIINHGFSLKKSNDSSVEGVLVLAGRTFRSIHSRKTVLIYAGKSGNDTAVSLESITSP